MAERKTTIKDGVATVFEETTSGYKDERLTIWRLSADRAHINACSNCGADGTGESTGRPVICFNPQEYDTVIICLSCMGTLAAEMTALADQGAI